MIEGVADGLDRLGEKRHGAGIFVPAGGTNEPVISRSIPS
jgi:hypothetical protein